MSTWSFEHEQAREKKMRPYMISNASELENGIIEYELNTA